MKISIVIPNFNGAHYLGPCLESIRKMTLPRHLYETIVIDNGSQDNSREVVNRFTPWVKLITLDRNTGFSGAVNIGIKASKGEFVVLLNNDTEVETDWLEELVQCIEKDENVFSVSSKMLRFNERSIIDDAGDQYTLMGWAFQRGNGLNQEKYNRDIECFSSCAGAAIYRKAIFDQIGYFDENFFAYMEDVDIGYRARIFGYRNLYCSQAVVYHVGSGTSGSKYNSFKIKLAARNNIYVIVKNMPPTQILINLPFLVLGFIIRYLSFLRMGFGREYWEGFKEGIRGARSLERVPFSCHRLGAYLSIQWRMNTGLIEYLYQKLLHR